MLDLVVYDGSQLLLPRPQFSDEVDQGQLGAFKTETGRAIGGVNLHLVQIAEQMAARDHEVVVVADVEREQWYDGVQYVPRSWLGKLRPSRACLVRAESRIRFFDGKPFGADRVVVLATNVPSGAHDALAGVLCRDDFVLMCMSEWQAGWYRARNKIVVPPMLDPVERCAKEPGLFVYAASPHKGLAATLAAWRKMKASRGKVIAGTRLVVAASVGDWDEIRDTPDCEWLGRVDPREIRRTIARAVGLYHVSTFAETFFVPAAVAERTATRTHICCPSGVTGGIPEALTKRKLLTTDLRQFEDDFVFRWEVRDGGDAAAVADPDDLVDLSPAGLAPRVEAALFGGLG